MGMIAYLLIALAAMDMAQPEAAPEPGRKSYILTLQNGERRGVFWDERKELGNNIVRVELDTPWKPGFDNIKKSDIADYGSERQSAREDRIRQGWLDAGYTQVNGKPVLITEVELAQRARQMAGVTDASSAPPPSPETEETAQPVVSEAPPKMAERGLLAEWGPHIGVAAMALLLIGLVAKWLIFSQTG